MKIVKHPPITRGVTELMYVGDDDAVEKVTSHKTATLALASMGAGLLLIWFGTSRAAKTLGTALVAVPVATELYYHANGGCIYDDLP